jgi:hypothetical protein
MVHNGHSKLKWIRMITLKKHAFHWPFPNLDPFGQCEIQIIEIIQTIKRHPITKFGPTVLRIFHNSQSNHWNRKKNQISWFWKAKLPKWISLEKNYEYPKMWWKSQEIFKYTKQETQTTRREIPHSLIDLHESVKSIWFPRKSTNR